MAFTNFYIQTTGNDMNAGTSTADSADVTSTNGDYGNAAANRFTAASGTPFSAVNVGDWASIYVDGTTSGAVYVAQVTVINASGASIDTSTTAKYGTAPSNSATGRSCKINGAWASEASPVAMGSTSVPASTKVNIKAGTYTIASSRTIAWAGATTTPLWFDGYNTTPGDLDSDTTNSLAKPVWAQNATFVLQTTGAHQIWSNLSVTGNRSGSVWANAVSTTKIVRCRCENTSSNGSAIAWNAMGGPMLYCWAKIPTTGDRVIASPGVLVGTIVVGGGSAGGGVSVGSLPVVGCISINSAGYGFLMTSTSMPAFFCTVYNATGDAFRWPSGLTAGSGAVGCIAETCGGVGIDNATGTNTNLLTLAANDFHSCTGGNTVGFGDSPAWFGQTDSSTIVTSATDMTPVSGANARAHGFPGIFENQTFSSYQNIGAVQQVQPAAGSTGFFIQ